jgi:hypothetical protein
MNNNKGNTMKKNPINKAYTRAKVNNIDNIFTNISLFISKYKKEGLLIIITLLLSVIINHSLIKANNKSQKQIVTVDILNITRDFTISLAKSNMSDEQIIAEIQGFSVELDHLLTSLSKENNIIIMPSQAVSSGVQDITQHVKQIMVSTKRETIKTPQRATDSIVNREEVLKTIEEGNNVE